MFSTADRNRFLVLCSLFIVPSLAHAHVGIGQAGGFGQGFSHPLGGLDHLCAMVAVGLWAAQRGGRALWAVPLTFVTVMALGGIIGMAGIGIPFVETGILLSVLLLGVLIAASVRLPLAANIAIVALFAIFHGYAHGAEMPANASGIAYAAGFAFSTSLLHLCGIGLGIAIQKLATPQFVRFAGAAIVLFSAWLWVG